VPYLPEVCVLEGLEVRVIVRQSSLFPLTLCAGHCFPRRLYFLGPPLLGLWRWVEGGGGYFGGGLDGVSEDGCPLVEIVWGGVLAEKGPTGGCGGRQGLQGCNEGIPIRFLLVEPGGARRDFRVGVE
jgi:hypothetical protein